MRLTKRSNKTVHENGVCCTHYLSKECEERSGFCTDECPWEEAVWSKLADYEDAEEQGLLLQLPCKVGDTVYLINHTTVNTRRKPLKCNVDEFVIERSGCFAVLNGNASYYMLRRFKAVNINKFGSIVFLTEAEAESALAEKGGAE